MPRKSSSSSKPPERKTRFDRFMPDPRFVRGEVDRHLKLLLAAAMNPATAMATLKAMGALRQAAEVGLTRGPQDPRVQAAVKEAERELLFAIQEAVGAMLLEMGAQAATQPAPPQEERIVEVPLQRTEEAHPHVAPRRPDRKGRAKVSEGA